MEAATTQDSLAVEERSEDPSAVPQPSERNGGPTPGEPVVGGESPTAPEQHLPVDSLKEAAPYLRRPFTERAVQWKVQSAFGDKGFLAVAYIDARLVVDRLNVVCPHLWHEDIEELPSTLYRCALTIDGITHTDVGEGSGTTRVKAGYSDALKRAAVKFGVGVSVYKIPQATIWTSDQEKKGYYTYKLQKDKHVYRFTPEGEAALRTFYGHWLEKFGVPVYGQPIDHGDVEGSAGALVDEGGIQSAEEPQSDLRDVPMPLTDEKADSLRLACRDIYATVPKAKLPKARFEAELKQASVSHDALEEMKTRLEGMSK